MIESPASTANFQPDLPARMVESHQLSAIDAEELARLRALGEARADTEEEVLQWLAGEYGLTYTSLENVEPEHEILTKFPARILLKEELLPLRQEGEANPRRHQPRCSPSRGWTASRPFTTAKLQPVLAPGHALQREIKKHLGVGADTLNLLEQDEGFQVVADDHAEDGDLDKAAEDASIIRFVNQISQRRDLDALIGHPRRAVRA